VTVSQTEQVDSEQASPPRNPNRPYIIFAAVLLVVIVVAAILLITQGLPALQGEQTPTAVTGAESTATQVPTFTPGPTSEPTNTPLPPAEPTSAPPVMADTDVPIFDFESAGARPGQEWTGFLGQVLDAAGKPVEGVAVIVWYRDGQPAAPAVRTGREGDYEIRLADTPLAGIWSIQLLTDDNLPASKLFTFETDENTETGIQQIQVIWKQIP
jgi:hypothetical protein